MDSVKTKGAPGAKAVMLLLEEYLRGMIADEVERMRIRLLQSQGFYIRLEINKLRQELREAGVLPKDDRDEGNKKAKRH